MSPEALDGAPTDVAADLWALSLVLVEALVGSHPFRDARTLSEVRAAVDKVGGSAFLQLRDVAPEAASFLAACLHPDLSKRPPTASAFRKQWTTLRPRETGLHFGVGTE
jgi:serine/threonine protein kinase